MKKVLWYSKKEAKENSYNLSLITGDEYELICIDKFVKTGSELAELAQDVDVLVVDGDDQSISFMADLFRHKKEKQIVCFTRDKKVKMPNGTVVTIYDGWEVYAELKSYLVF